MWEQERLGQSGHMMRRLMIGFAALCLCACQRDDKEAFVAPRLAPGAPSRAWPPQGWAWGLLRIGQRPSLRYGVSAPATAPTGDVIILPGYGESAEWWFETAADLNGEGYRVWILDGDGQGGSARYTSRRDLGHTASFQRDVDGLRVLIRRVVRAPADHRVAVIASGTAAVSALAAAEQGAPMDRIILTSPSELSVGSSGLPVMAAKLGLTTLRASGGAGWRRDAREQARTPREKAALGWALANPDLRMGGPSTGWLEARRAFRADALAQEALRKVAAPVTIFTPEANGSVTCGQIARCMIRPLPARLPYHIEDDAVRGAWLGALIGELGTDHAP